MTTANTAKTEYKKVPGITTIIDVMSKPSLVYWANQIGLEGHKYSEYRSKEAEAGKLIHKMIEQFLKIGKIDFEYLKNIYTPQQIAYCKNKAQHFFNWVKTQDFKIIESEIRLTSDWFCGTLDLYCELNGKKTIIDIKTSKKCFLEAHTQVVAGAMLLRHNEYEVDDYKIIRIGRSKEEEDFEVIQVQDIELHENRFEACLNLYNANLALNEANYRY